VRIGHVTDFFLPRLGGIEMQVNDLARRQAAAGHDVEVVTGSPADPDLPTDAGVEILRVAGGRGRLSMADLRVPLKGRQLVIDRKYDVVHVHAGLGSPLAFAVAAQAGRSGVPTVVTMHSLLAYLSGMFRALDVATHWSSWPVVWTAVSDVAAEPLRDLSRGRLDVGILPNGIEASDWRIPVSPRVDPTVVITSVMRLALRKRPSHLVQILKHARTQVPAEIPLEAVIVGDGPRLGATERAVRRAGIEDWVTLTGRLDRPAIKSLLVRSDMFVAPAILESFGIAALEARCAGVPVVARADGGVAEFIKHGHEGLLAADDAELAQCIALLANDPARRAAIADHNRATDPCISWGDTLARAEAAYATASDLMASAG
jgi:glycosyltransferase involved in cell wall biosynthesis